MAIRIEFHEPDVRLAQFLYVGKEYADYQPGNWFVHDYFFARNVSSIDPEKQLLPVQIITKVKFKVPLMDKVYRTNMYLL